MSSNEVEKAEGYIREKLFSPKTESFSEHGIADIASLSRTPVRQALMYFRGSGIITNTPGLTSEIGIKIQEARDLLDIREVYGKLVIVRCIERGIKTLGVVEAQLEFAEEAGRKSDIARHLVAISDANVILARRVAGAAIAYGTRSMLDGVYAYTSKAEWSTGDFDKNVELHRRLVTALKGQNSDLALTSLQEISRFDAKKLQQS